MKAVDADIGPNAAVRYRLKQDNTGDWSTFSIDQDSGLITLKQPLDRETQKLYQVIKLNVEFNCICALRLIFIYLFYNSVVHYH